VTGFDYGVKLGYPAGVRGQALVENMLIRGSKAQGIAVLGYGSVIVRNNTIADTVGPRSWGIEAQGRDDPSAGGVNNSHLLVENNRVVNTRSVGPVGFAGQTALGIYAHEAADSLVLNNFVAGVSTEAANQGAVGIELFLRIPQTFLADGNTVLNEKVTTTPADGTAVSQISTIYTGPVAIFGSVTNSRVYNFKEGITANSAIGQGNTCRQVISAEFSNNVVGGATLNYYLGGQMGSGNRTE